jgi:hypothetical protein
VALVQDLWQTGGRGFISTIENIPAKNTLWIQSYTGVVSSLSIEQRACVLFESEQLSLLLSVAQAVAQEANAKIKTFFRNLGYFFKNTTPIGQPNIPTVEGLLQEVQSAFEGMEGVNHEYASALFLLALNTSSSLSQKKFRDVLKALHLILVAPHGQLQTPWLVHMCLLEFLAYQGVIWERHFLPLLISDFGCISLAHWLHFPYFVKPQTAENIVHTGIILTLGAVCKSFPESGMIQRLQEEFHQQKGLPTTNDFAQSPLMKVLTDISRKTNNDIKIRCESLQAQHKLQVISKEFSEHQSTIEICKVYIISQRDTQALAKIEQGNILALDPQGQPVHIFFKNGTSPIKILSLPAEVQEPMTRLINQRSGFRDFFQIQTVPSLIVPLGDPLASWILGQGGIASAPESSPLAIKALTFQDHMELGFLALNARQMGLAKVEFLTAKEQLDDALAKHSDTTPASHNVQVLLKERRHVAESLEVIFYREVENKTDPWSRTQVYLRALREIDSHPMRSHLFALALGAGTDLFQAALQSLGEPLQPEADFFKKTANAGKVLLYTTFNGCWLLNERAVQQFSRLERRHGSVHRVAQVGELYIKENPGCVGLAFAAWALSRWLFFDVPNTHGDVGTIPVQPAKIVRFSGVNYVQLAPAIHGQNVRELLNSPDPEALKNMDPFYFSALVVLSILLNMEDGRDANFVVQGSGNHRRLLSVDNDHVFIQEAVTDRRLHVKNLVFCLQDMKNQIEPRVRAHVLSFRSDLFSRLCAWLHSVSYYNNAVNEVFGLSTIGQLYNRTKDEERVILSAFFESEGLTQPCLKLLKIYDAFLRLPETSTHQDLLQEVQPRVADIYKNSFTGTTLKARMDIVGGLGGPSQSTAALLVDQVLRKRVKDYADFVQKQGKPQDLILMLREIRTKTDVLKLVRTGLQQGDWSTFRADADVQEHVLKTLDQAHYGSPAYTSVQHQQLLQALHPELMELTFQGNERLTDDDLMEAIRRLPRLKTLSLDNCTRLTGVVRDWMFQRSVWITECAERGVKTIKITRCGALDIQLGKTHHEESSRLLILQIDAPPAWTTEVRRLLSKKEKNFQKWYLPGVNLEGMDLRGTNFRGADLTGAKFAGADMSSFQERYEIEI